MVTLQYTEALLTRFMERALGDLKDEVGFTDDTFYLDAIEDTCLAYGVSDVVDATDVKKLRALARVCLWRDVLFKLTAMYDYSEEEEAAKRSQLYRQAESSLRVAERLAAPYDPLRSVQMGRIIWKSDPYQYLPDDKRTI